MKIKDIDYYVKFIFSTIDGEHCFSTTDRELLKFVKSYETDNQKNDFDIGDLIYFEPNKIQFKITNIHIRRLAEDTDDFTYGFDISDCSQQQGEIKEPLLIIHITIERN